MQTGELNLIKDFESANTIDAEYYTRFDVKRGLRNEDGTGVIAGITNIADVQGYTVVNGAVKAVPGRLILRGYDIIDLLAPAFNEGRFCFEEISYLLLTGELPTKQELADFIAALDAERELPNGFTADYIMKPVTSDISNCLARSILMLYADDPNAEDRSVAHEVHAAISLLSRLPRIAVLAYYARQAGLKGGSMIMHRFVPGQLTAETILSMLRPDRQYTHEEALMLDIMLSLHAEHGGGNNSTFVARVVTSADTDPYSAYASAIGSLKGYRHGGANAKVTEMQSDIKEHVKDWSNEDELTDYLRRIIEKEAFDKTGLIYGMGHAVYTLSDPRAELCKNFARRLAAGTEYEAELRLLEDVERLAPPIFADIKGSQKPLCANIDMYSGFVYKMLGIPARLITPLFVCSRMSGWIAHRFGEIVSGKRIIRPAYKATSPHREYLPMDER